ncbi:GGDEF domain-containing protein [Luteimonas saliphila]|uniref:GGDEF domain-containing protein n=1 Tax=Luteimonas saliphila TaxID=2804919 RepID=UPI00192E2A54|nr:GGDEF domain-containing protein [Luteimonas saliphila]
MVRCSPHGAAWLAPILLVACVGAAAQTVLPVSSQAQALARCERLVGAQPTVAEAAAREVLDATGTSPDQRLIATVCLAAAQVLAGRGEAGGASLDAAQELLDAPGVTPTGRLEGQARLPGLLMRVGRLDEALAMQESVLVGARERGIVPMQIDALRFLGQVRAGEFDDPEGALPYFRQAYDLHRSLTGSGARPNPVVAYDLGYTLLLLGRHDEADAMLVEAARAAAAPELVGLGDRIASHRAELLRLRGDAAAAEPQFAAVLARQRAGNDVAGQAVTLQRLARARLDSDRAQEALAPAREALAVAEQARLTAEQRDALGVLADVHAALGQRDAAAAHAARSREAGRAIDRETTARRLAGLQARAASELEPGEAGGRVAEPRKTWLRNVAIVALALLALGALLLLARAQRRHRELAALSATDALTQLPDRRHASRHIEALAADDAARAAVLLIDIDRFRAINDRLGHATGDRVLEAVARCLRDACDAGDLVARWDGGEFLVLRENTSPEAAFALAAHLRAQVERLQVDDGRDAQPSPLSASIGVASLPLFAGGGGAWQDAMRAAERALHVAKRAGGNAWAGLWGVAVDVDAVRALDDVPAALAAGVLASEGSRVMDWSSRAADAVGSAAYADRPPPA